MFFCVVIVLSGVSVRVWVSVYKSAQVYLSLSLFVQVCLVCSLTVLASSCLPAWMAVCLSYIYIILP